MLQLEKGVLNLYLIISTLNMSYIHDDMFKWYRSIKDLDRKMKPMQLTADSSSGLLSTFPISTGEIRR